MSWTPALSYHLINQSSIAAKTCLRGLTFHTIPYHTIPHMTFLWNIIYIHSNVSMFLKGLYVLIYASLSRIFTPTCLGITSINSNLVVDIILFPYILSFAHQSFQPFYVLMHNTCIADFNSSYTLGMNWHSDNRYNVFECPTASPLQIFTGPILSYTRFPTNVKISDEAIVL